MNERIKELAVQAGLKMCSCGCDMPTRQSVKFAELIVRECAEICMIEYDTGLEMAPQAPWIAKQIKDHFGVEE